MADFRLISPKENEILELLSKHGPLYGLEMIGLSKELKRGTVYTTLHRLEDKQLVRSHEVLPAQGEQGPARRVYQISGWGKWAIEARRAFVDVMKSR